MPDDPVTRSARRPLRVLVLTGDHASPDATKLEGVYSHDDLRLDREMRRALSSLPSLAVEFLPEHDRLLDRLTGDPPELIVNFCDTGFHNVAEHELHVPALLELLGVPYTGAPPACMALCYDKAVVRLLAQSLGIPVPHEAAVGPEALAVPEGPYPALIKPCHGDGSVGITRDAVVADPAAARRYLTWLRRHLPGRTALVQEYLPGPEYGLALIGNPGAGLTALPPLRVDFSELPEGLPPILAFESKTGAQSETPYGKVRIVPAELPPKTEQALRGHAERLFIRLGCRDYARFDFRTGADGEIKLIEVNPNPAWDCEAKLALMAGFAGRSYTELLATILEAARRRLAL